MTEDQDFAKLRHELRRGAVVLAVLAQMQTERYGYSLRKSLLETGFDIEESTLYPLIRRLEQQGLLTSEWREESRRRKRFYRISAAGQRMLQRLRAEWQQQHNSLQIILNGGSE